MELQLNFGPAGNVTASTINATPPVCEGQGSYAYVGPDGYYHCSEPEEPGKWGKVIVAIAVGYVLMKVYGERMGKRVNRVKQGDMGRFYDARVR